MRFRQCFALTFLSLLCADLHSGVLLKDFKKDKSKTEESKKDTQDKSMDVASDKKSTDPASTDSETGQNTDQSKEDHIEATGNESPETAQPAAVEKKKIVGDPIVLKIGRKEFKRSQILADLRLIPPQLVKGVPADKLFGMLVDQKMSTYLMVEQAKKAEMDKTKDFLSKIERMKEELLARTFLMKEISPKAENESTLKARYTKYLVEFKKGKEHQVWHIMLPTEDEAKKVVEALNSGADFGKLAKEKSMAPSKENNGEEGYIPLSLLPPSIGQKLLTLKKGEYTKEAIKTEGGFHIFKIGDSRDTTPQKFEEIKDMLKQMIVQEEIMKMIDRLEKQYNVEKFNEDGSPIVKNEKHKQQ